MVARGHPGGVVLATPKAWSGIRVGTKDEWTATLICFSVGGCAIAGG